MNAHGLGDFDGGIEQKTDTVRRGFKNIFIDGLGGLVKKNLRALNRLATYCTTNTGPRIVLGRHGKGGLQEFLLGSVAQDVVCAAACDVLVAPPPGASEAAGDKGESLG